MSGLGGITAGLVMDEDGNVRPVQRQGELPMEGRFNLLPYAPEKGANHWYAPKGYGLALPGAIAGTLNEGQLPLRSMRGEYVSPEEAMNFPLNVMGGSGVKGALESFGGRIGYGRLVQAGLREAASLPLWDALQKRLDDGWEPTQKDLNNIWQTHKLSLGHGDRKIRFEMDPSQTWVVKGALPQKSGESVPLKSAVKNPEFEVAYPELFDQGKITMDPPGLNRGGSMASWRNEMTVAPNASLWTPTKLKQLVEHELTHYPERLEGFSSGGSGDYALGGILTGKLGQLKSQQALEAADIWMEARKSLPINVAKEVEAAYPGAKIDDTTTIPDFTRIVLNALDHAGRDAILTPTSPHKRTRGQLEKAVVSRENALEKIRKRAAVLNKADELKNDAYFRLGGEQNANLAEHRVDMGPEARAVVPPATPLQTGGRMLHRGRSFYPAKDEYNIETPGVPQKIQGDVVAALRNYASDPNGYKKKYADTGMPVHIIPRGGLRARNITDEMRNAPIVGEDEVRLDPKGKMHATSWKGTQYHGADTLFDKFNDSLIGTRTDPGFFGEGHYFAPDAEIAKRWGINVKKTDIELQNPLRISGVTDFQRKVGWKPVGTDREAYAQQMKKVTAELKARGYDGVVRTDAQGRDWAVVFSASSLK